MSGVPGELWNALVVGQRQVGSPRKGVMEQARSDEERHLLNSEHQWILRSEIRSVRILPRIDSATCKLRRCGLQPSGIEERNAII